MPIISVLLIVVFAIGAYLFWWPCYQEFSGLKAQYAAKESDIKQKEQYLADMKVVLEKVSSEYKDEYGKIDSALPEDISVLSLYNYLLKASSENGLILEDISWPQISSLSDVHKASFSVTLSGSYSAFKNFLSTLYKSGRLIEAESMNFSSVGVKGNTIRFMLSLSTYGYMEPKAGGAEQETGGQ